MNLVPGESIGPYILLSQLGRGGMGEVWKAQRPDDNHPVALKILHTFTSETMARLQREGELQRRVKSEHVVDVLDRFTHEECPVIAMEYI